VLQPCHYSKTRLLFFAAAAAAAAATTCSGCLSLCHLAACLMTGFEEASSAKLLVPLGVLWGNLGGIPGLSPFMLL